MGKRVVVWGTGNVGRPAIRAVLAHQDLELAGVIVSNPAKVGKDAGDIVGLPSTGVLATNDPAALLKSGVDAVVYTATADTRPMEAVGDLLRCLGAGANVVSTSFYPLLYPPTAPKEFLDVVEGACDKGKSSVFVSGIDPGWGMDILPIMLSGVVADIREVRAREIFNYGLYDAPDVVRNVIGFGLPMDTVPPMLHEQALRTVWEPMVRIIADGMGTPVDAVNVSVERRPLEQSIDVPGMGRFEAGTQGAFRFQILGLRGGEQRVVVEHITRIDDACAPDWDYPPEGRGCHQVIITGTPTLHVSLYAEDAHEPGPAGGGNATAANRLVNAIPQVCAAKPGIVTPLDLAPITGGKQLRK